MSELAVTLLKKLHPKPGDVVVLTVDANSILDDPESTEKAVQILRDAMPPGVYILIIPRPCKIHCLDDEKLARIGLRKIQLPEGEPTVKQCLDEMGVPVFTIK